MWYQTNPTFIPRGSRANWIYAWPKKTTDLCHHIEKLNQKINTRVYSSCLTVVDKFGTQLLYVGNGLLEKNSDKQIQMYQKYMQDLTTSTEYLWYWLICFLNLRKSGFHPKSAIHWKGTNLGENHWKLLDGIGSVAFLRGQYTSPQLHPCHRLFNQDGHQHSSTASL